MEIAQFLQLQMSMYDKILILIIFHVCCRKYINAITWLHINQLEMVFITQHKKTKHIKHHKRNKTAKETILHSKGH